MQKDNQMFNYRLHMLHNSLRENPFSKRFICFLVKLPVLTKPQRIKANYLYTPRERVSFSEHAVLTLSYDFFICKRKAIDSLTSDTRLEFMNLV